MAKKTDIDEQVVQSQMGRVGERSAAILAISLVVRTAHQVGAAIFLTYYLLAPLESLPRYATPLAMVSGVALVATEWLRHRQLYRELSGLITIAKCLLLGMALHGILPAMPAVLLAFIIASIGAHAPKQVRHRLLF